MPFLFKEGRSLKRIEVTVCEGEEREGNGKGMDVEPDQQCGDGSWFQCDLFII